MKNNPWEKTQLKISGVPENWTETKIGDIETNVYQSTYQNHLQGNISDSTYREFQKMMDWKS